MREREAPAGESTDEQLVRARLNQLVDDVQPDAGSLTRVLARSRRRRVLRRPVVAGVGVAVAATVALLAVVVPAPAPSGPQVVGTAPDTYVTQVRSGVLARVDLGSGRRVGEPTRLPGRVTSLATDGARVYAAVAGERHRVYELEPGQDPRLVATAPAGTPITEVTAVDGRMAYLAGDAVVVPDPGGARTVGVPGRAVDLAVAADGRLVVLSVADGSRRARLHALPPGSTSWSPLPSEQECAPLALAPTGSEVAAVYQVGCEDGAGLRVATFDPVSGERVSAGTPFDIGAASAPARVHLSVGRLGRYLVSVPAAGRWVVDGARVRAVPGACESDGHCLDAPSAL